MADHALLSPSSAKRWLACTPSARFEEQFPSSTSVYAEEGTLAHALAEILLKVRLGMMPMKEGHHKREEIEANPLYTTEMLTHCEQYADYCMALVKEGSVVYVETKVDITSHIPEGFGTNDFMVYTPSIRLVEVVDLKYGKGVPVSAVENDQEKIYAIGGMDWFNWLYEDKIDTVRAHIYQPRIGNYSSWEIAVPSLLKWGSDVLKPQALKAFAGEGEYVVGDHCKFCRARFRCKASEDRMTDIFDHALAERTMLDDAAIVRILERAPLLISWLNDLSDYALAEAVKGKQWAGMKLVEGKSNRVFASATDTEKKLLEAGHKDIYTPAELLGVTKLKTVLGAKVFKELVEPDLRKPPGKPTLVSADDPRPDFDRASAVFRDVVLATEEE